MSYNKGIIYPANPSTTRGVSTKLSSSGDKIAYTNGRSVIIRDLNNTTLAVTYAGHVSPTTVARISPSGYYCASADAVGNVRIWDTVGEDQVLKNEVKVIAGKINDLAWDGESKRIIAVGDGRERFGHAFLMDSGSAAGEIIGHSKVINAVSIRHQRPFRAVTGSDDNSIVFYTGVPFKYEKTIKTHTRYVQDIKFSPSGDHFASVGADGKLFLYDGATGDVKTEFTEGAHTGSVMAASWSPDSKYLVTSSADTTVKLWDIETSKALTTWSLGAGIDNQQVGNTWAGEGNIVSLSMSGTLNIFDRRVGDKAAKHLYGSQKGITSAIVSPSLPTILAGSYDGRVLSYSTSANDEFVIKPLDGDGHTAQVVQIAKSAGGDGIWTAGFDDQIREISGGTGFTSTPSPTASQPRAIAALGSTLFEVNASGIEVFEGGKKVVDVPLKWAPTSIAAGNGGRIAVGAEDGKIHLYDWDSSAKGLKEGSTLAAHTNPVTALAFSPDGLLLAGGDSLGKINLFDVPGAKIVTGRWSNHSARIYALVFSPSGKHVASASLDTHVYIWSVERPMKNIPIKNAVAGGATSVDWLGLTEDGKGGKVVVGGADGCLRTFEVTFHA